MLEEIWKPIPEWEDKYEASNLGRIRSLLNNQNNPRPYPKILRPSLCKGYLAISLCRNQVLKTHRVHTLVLMAFVGPRLKGQVCAHYDGNQINNVLSNLRWTTQFDNSRDTMRHGRYRVGEHCPRALFTANQVRVIRTLCASGVSQTEVGRRFGARPCTISQIVNNKAYKNVI